MRLIDADAFKQELSALCIHFNFDIERVSTMLKIIDAQPTAYDVDKVISLINIHIEDWNKCVRKDIADGHIKALTWVREIVKGAVKDE